jgi:hypothetical protein
MLLTQLFGRAAALGVMLVFMHCGSTLHAATKEPAAPRKAISVLFIGNSYTFVNELPVVFTKLAAARGQRVTVLQVAPGGCTLQQHVTQSGAVAQIAARKWDYVVLQEQSQVPFMAPQMMFTAARKLNADIAADGAKTVFFMTWARQAQPKNQAAITRAYNTIGRELGATVAPVGVAWESLLKSGVKDLYQADGSHPGPLGTYLAGCAFYGTLFQRSPVGLPASLKLSNSQTLKVSVEQARRAQQAAWEAVQKNRP